MPLTLKSVMFLCLSHSHNRLASLPHALSNLDKPIYLNLTDNQLSALPNWIGQLNELVELRLYGNLLSSRPLTRYLYLWLFRLFRSVF